MEHPPSPPPARIGPRRAVPVDIERVEAEITFDVAARTATVAATVDFALEGYGGCPVLDLRQPVGGGIRLDGRAMAGEAFSPIDLGGGPGAEMRLLDADLDAGTRHRLELGYGLTTPAAEGAVPIGWADAGVRFDFWLSDLHPGRYLEMWLPANLCHDRFELALDVRVEGGDGHTVLTNATVQPTSPNRWRIEYPATFTSL